MFLDRGEYLLLDEWDRFGIKAIYTKKSFGNVMELSATELKESLNLTDKTIVAGHQTHSDNIVVIEDLERTYFENTDGFITNRTDVLIFTKYADCLPIYFCDRVNGVIALVHSGWQGSYKEIGKKAIELMQKRYGSSLENIEVAFGIGICQDRYEVGNEFVEKFKEKFSMEILEKAFVEKDGKIYFDNQEFNYQLMLNLGVRNENILLNEYCTYNGEFHSYRRDREKSGRNGAFICYSNKE